MIWFTLNIIISILISTTENDLLIFPLQRKLKPYIELTIDNSNIKMSLTTSLSNTIIFKDSPSQENTGSTDHITFPYSRYLLNGKEHISNIRLREIKSTQLTLKDYSYYTVNLNTSSNNEGYLAFPRISEHHKETIMKKLYIHKHIALNTFALVTTSKETDINKHFLIMGKYIDIVKYLNINTHYVTYCLLSLYDNILHSKWTCRLKYIAVPSSLTKLTNNTSDKVYTKVNYIVFFDPIINEIVFPYEHKEYILEQIFQNYSFDTLKHCLYFTQNEYKVLFNLNTEDNRETNYEGIKCNKNTINITSFDGHLCLVLNGYSFCLNGLELFNCENNDNNWCYLNVLFVNKTTQYVIVGNSFINKLQGIIYDDEEAKIFFLNYPTDFPINVNKINVDIRESRGILFYLLSIVCVIVLILLALLIPYYFYRRSRRKMRDHLQYEIIYRKVKDTSQRLLDIK